MQPYPLEVLSYHKFTAQESEYPFSRTYKQFANDLIKKDFDWITIDDGLESILKACEMMQAKNIRAKIFVCSSLVGKPGYCKWSQLWRLSKFHDIENHSHLHLRHCELTAKEVFKSMNRCSREIKRHIGRKPRFFVPPYNNFNESIEVMARRLGMVLLKERTEIRNNSR